jgi:hypothetical protein
MDTRDFQAEQVGSESSQRDTIWHLMAIFAGTF